MTYVIVTQIAGQTRVYGTWIMREDAEDWAKSGCIGLSWEVIELINT